jgi:hypothetical protein
MNRVATKFRRLLRGQVTAPPPDDFLIPCDLNMPMQETLQNGILTVSSGGRVSTTGIKRFCYNITNESGWEVKRSYFKNNRYYWEMWKE